MFNKEGDDLADFYDFTEEIIEPDVKIEIRATRMIQTIGFLPNKHLIIEGPML